MKRPVKPYKQGHLDSLCGLYAIVNAVYCLHPEIDEEYFESLFARLIDAIGRRSPKPFETLKEGMSGTLFRNLLEVAITDFARKHNAAIAFQRMKQLQRTSIEDLFARLRMHLDSGAVAILSLRGKCDHYTVAYKVSSKKIWLIDSDGRKFLKQERCTLEDDPELFRIVRQDLLLVTREVTK